jgi:hypothetical protein
MKSAIYIFMLFINCGVIFKKRTVDKILHILYVEPTMQDLYPFPICLGQNLMVLYPNVNLPVGASIKR